MPRDGDADGPGRAWHPLDGRITELGMHLTVNPPVRHNVVVGLAAARVTSGTDSLMPLRYCVNDSGPSPMLAQ